MNRTLLRPLMVALLVLPHVLCADVACAQPIIANRPPEEEAIDALYDLGARIGQDHQAAGRPITYVSISRTITDQDLDPLRVLVHLETLHIDGGVITDAGLERLSGLTKLKELYIHDSRFTDQGLAHLRELRSIERLSLDSQITGTGLAHLGGLPKLSWLRVGNAQLSDTGMMSFHELVQIEMLDLHHVSMTDAGLVHLRGMRRLELLTLSANGVTADGVLRLVGMPRLNRITLTGTEVTPDGESRLRKAMPYALINFSGRRQSGGEPQPLCCWQDWAAGVCGILAALAVLALIRWRRIGLAAPRPLPQWCWTLVAALVPVLAVAAGVASNVERMRPVRDGDVDEFWLSACAIDVSEGQTHRWGRAYLPRDEWFIYYTQGFHDKFIYRVKASDAVARLPRVVEILSAAPPEALRTEVYEGFQAWKRTNPRLDDAAVLLEKIREARLNRLHRENNLGLFQLVSQEEDIFEKRWQRIQRYSLNSAFEFLYLSALAMFAIWPWLRGARPWQWALHIGLTPILFVLPFWLGYAQFTFTSAGPSGGVLYPWLVVHFPRGDAFNEIDRLIVRHMPQLLEPLSQSLGPMLSLSGGGTVSPTRAATIGAILAMIVFAWRTAVQRLRPATRVEPSH